MTVLFRSVNYSLKLSYKLANQNRDKNLFVPFYVIVGASGKGSIASMQSKLTYFPDTYYNGNRRMGVFNYFPNDGDTNIYRQPFI